VSAPWDDVSGWLIGQTPTGVISLVCLLVIKGYLVPPNLVHRDEYDRVKAERDQMTTLAMTLLDQNQKLLNASLRSVDVLEAIPVKGGES
jgi:hypothetical protein